MYILRIFTSPNCYFKYTVTETGLADDIIKWIFMNAISRTLILISLKVNVELCNEKSISNMFDHFSPAGVTIHGFQNIWHNRLCHYTNITGASETIILCIEISSLITIDYLIMRCKKWTYIWIVMANCLCVLFWWLFPPLLCNLGYEYQNDTPVNS